MNYKRLVISLVLPQLAGLIGSIFTVTAIPIWYATLQKPGFNPPNWLFGPVWVTLYFLMGIAFFLIWNNIVTASSERRKGIYVFFLQLVLNALWSIIFFGLHSPFWALMEIIILWLAIIWTILVFYKISRLAAYLLLPYILWVSFAACLNGALWLLN